MSFSPDPHLRDNISKNVWFLQLLNCYRNTSSLPTQLSFNLSPISTCFVLFFKWESETAFLSLYICLCSFSKSIFSTEKQYGNNYWGKKRKRLLRLKPSTDHWNIFGKAALLKYKYAAVLWKHKSLAHFRNML